MKKHIAALALLALVACTPDNAPRPTWDKSPKQECVDSESFNAERLSVLAHLKASSESHNGQVIGHELDLASAQLTLMAAAAFKAAPNAADRLLRSSVALSTAADAARATAYAAAGTWVATATDLWDQANTDALPFCELGTS